MKRETKGGESGPVKRAIAPEEYERLAADSWGVLGVGSFRTVREIRCPLCRGVMVRQRGTRRWVCRARDPRGFAHCIVEVSWWSLAVDP